MRVRAGGRSFAVQVRRVLGVLRLPPGNPLPGAPRWLGGLWAWRGEALPGVRLAELFGGESSPQWLVILEAEAPIGLLVEEVLGTAETEWSPAEDPLLVGISEAGEGVIDPQGILKVCESWFSGRGT